MALIRAVFQGLNFGLAGISAALLGLPDDSYGAETVYRSAHLCPWPGSSSGFFQGSMM